MHRVIFCQEWIRKGVGRVVGAGYSSILIKFGKVVPLAHGQDANFESSFGCVSVPCDHIEDLPDIDHRIQFYFAFNELLREVFDEEGIVKSSNYHLYLHDHYRSRDLLALFAYIMDDVALSGAIENQQQVSQLTFEFRGVRKRCAGEQHQSG